MPPRDPHLDDALRLVSEIHAQVARGAHYRGYRAAPVAAMGALALACAAWQQLAGPTPDPQSFAAQWTGVAVLAATFAAVDIALRWSSLRGRDTIRALGQIAPALGVGLVLTPVLWERAELLPGAWTMVFGLGVLASSVYLPRAVLGVALFYLAAGAAMALGAREGVAPSPWGMGLTYGAGQLVTAAALRRRGDAE